MSNIFKTELIQPYAYNFSSTGHGELVKHDGYWSINLEPNKFYNGSQSPILQNEFYPNTQYLFDMWIDGDLTVYQDINRPAGLTIIYTDDSTYSFVITGSASNPKGYQHIVYVTPSNKSVKCINTYYFTSFPTYYRIDSFIIPVSNVQFYKTGILESDNITEILSGTSKAGIQHGNIFANQFYEI